VKGFDDELEEVEHIEESIGLQAERLFTGRSESKEGHKKSWQK